MNLPPREGVTAGGEVFVARTDYFSCFGRLYFFCPGLSSSIKWETGWDHRWTPIHVWDNYNLCILTRTTSKLRVLVPPYLLTTDWYCQFYHQALVREIPRTRIRQIREWGISREATVEMLLALVSSFRADLLPPSLAYSCLIFTIWWHVQINT